MSSPDRAALIAAISSGVMRFQDETQSYDEAVGRGYDLNGAERQCLSVVAFAPQPASAVARATRRTPAAVTALIDRLETRGFVHRTPDPDDRRRVLVAATSKTNEMIDATYRHLAEAGARMMENYSDAELAAIARFLSDSIAVQERATDALIARLAPSGAKARTRR